MKKTEKKPIKLKVGAIIRQGGKILLIKERLNKNLSYGWNVCAGSWEENDGDLKNAAVREAKEEAGIEARFVGFYKAIFVDQEKLHEDIIECKAFMPDEILKMEDKEFISSTTAQILKDYAKNPSVLPLDSISHIEKEIKF